MPWWVLDLNWWPNLGVASFPWRWRRHLIDQQTGDEGRSWGTQSWGATLRSRVYVYVVCDLMSVWHMKYECTSMCDMLVNGWECIM